VTKSCTPIPSQSSFSFRLFHLPRFFLSTNLVVARHDSTGPPESEAVGIDLPLPRMDGGGTNHGLAPPPPAGRGSAGIGGTRQPENFPSAFITVAVRQVLALYSNFCRDDALHAGCKFTVNRVESVPNIKL